MRMCLRTQQLRPLAQPQKLLLGSPKLNPPTYIRARPNIPLNYSHRNRNRIIIIRAISIDEVPPNVVRRKMDKEWLGGFSLGIDLGLSRTGLALSKGFSVRPLTVLKLRGQKLENRLMEIAEKEEVDEFIIGLPKSLDGNETTQSNIVRSVAGRLAVRAADRGWRVYLLDEHGTSTEALDRMINMGLNSSARERKVDAYAATIILERYFSMHGKGIELLLPKHLDLQEKIRRGPPEEID